MTSGKRFIKTIKRTLIILVIALGAITWWAWEPDIPVEELKEKYAASPSSFITYDGMEVHYRIEGFGTPLLLLHGTAASLHTWDDWTSQLKDDFAIIRLDLPGFGLTGPDPQARYKVTDYVAFVDGFMKALGINHFALAGNSLGGSIAWHFAVLYPEKVEKLILIDPAGLPKDDPPAFVFRIAQNPLTASVLKRLTPRSIIAGNLKEVYYDDDKLTDSLIDRYHVMTLREGNRQAFVDRANTVEKLDPNLLKQIKCATLVQWGEHDAWIPVGDAEVFDALILKSQVIIYDNAGHVPMEEIPEKTARDAREFLQEDSNH